MEPMRFLRAGLLSLRVSFVLFWHAGKYADRVCVCCYVSHCPPFLSLAHFCLRLVSQDRHPWLPEDDRELRNVGKGNYNNGEGVSQFQDDLIAKYGIDSVTSRIKFHSNS